MGKCKMGTNQLTLSYGKMPLKYLIFDLVNVDGSIY